jgi:hypothetical protein
MDAESSMSLPLRGHSMKDADLLVSNLNAVLREVFSSLTKRWEWSEYLHQ